MRIVNSIKIVEDQDKKYLKPYLKENYPHWTKEQLENVLDQMYQYDWNNVTLGEIVTFQYKSGYYIQFEVLYIYERQNLKNFVGLEFVGTAG